MAKESFVKKYGGGKQFDGAGAFDLDYKSVKRPKRDSGVKKSTSGGKKK